MRYHSLLPSLILIPFQKVACIRPCCVIYCNSLPTLSPFGSGLSLLIEVSEILSLCHHKRYHVFGVGWVPQDPPHGLGDHVWDGRCLRHVSSFSTLLPDKFTCVRGHLGLVVLLQAAKGSPGNCCREDKTAAATHWRPNLPRPLHPMPHTWAIERFSCQVQGELWEIKSVDIILSKYSSTHFLQTPINRCARRVNGNKTKKNTNNSSADYDR